MKMLKRLFLVGALIAAMPAMAQEEISIEGKDFLSGAGDARLAEVAKQAAATGKKVVVTAPAYWQDKVNAKLHAGAANATVQIKEGFFENVIVRLEDNKPVPAKAAEAPAAAPSSDDAAKAAAAKAEAAKAEAAKAEAAKAEAAKAEAARAEAAKVEAARQQAAREEAARQETARAEAAKVEAAKAEAAKAEAAKAAAAKAETDRVAGIRARMEKSFNDGKAAEGSLNASALEVGDMIVVDGEIRGVVRRSGAHTQLFWLEGDLNLDRVEVLPIGENRYKINEPLKGTVVLRTHEKTQNFVANVPAPDAAERKSLEQQYAEGKDITETLHPVDLKEADVIYTGKAAAVVTRRSGNAVLKYWLQGDINLGQTGLSKQGSNAYRVQTDTIK
jgi:hypothetical protein